MDDMYISSMVQKLSPRKSFFNSNIFRLFLFISFSLIYFFLLSPLLENSIGEYVLNSVRDNRNITLNYLTPLYNLETYGSEYTITTLASSDINQGDTSNTNIQTDDPRVIAMQKFLFNYNSPIYPYSRTFITEADKYGLDWRLVASITGVESVFGNIIPKGTYNAWGWRGINKNPQGWSQFDSWNAGIAEVTSRLALGYGINLTPFQIEATYCPPCGLNPAHAWANGVSRYMRELKYYADNLK